VSITADPNMPADPVTSTFIFPPSTE